MDNSFIKLLNDYLKSIENPTSDGWDEKTQRWGEPKSPKTDKNQRGIGLDIKENKELAKYLKEHPREGNYLTKEEEEYFRCKHIDYLDDVFNRNAPLQKFSDKKKAMAMGLMYQGHGKRLWNDMGDGLYIAFQKGTDDEFQDAISKFYQGRNTERGRSHDSFWKRQQHINKPGIVIPKPNIQHTEYPDALRVNNQIIRTEFSTDGKLIKRKNNRLLPYRLEELLFLIRNFKFK